MIDVSDPTMPQELGGLIADSGGGDLEADRDIVFQAEPNYGLRVIQYAPEPTLGIAILASLPVLVLLAGSGRRRVSPRQ
jgi:hypothetical protein